MNKIITQLKSSFLAIAVVAVISLITTNSANAGFLDFAKDSVSYGVSYITPDNDQTEATPVKQEAKTTTVRTYKVIVSAYNSEPGQTDDSPCITASGYNVCDANTENIVAANFLPLHTKVKISGFNGIFSVEDRMNTRYSGQKDGHNFMDIWMKDKRKALEFGRQRRSIEIVVINTDK